MCVPIRAVSLLAREGTPLFAFRLSAQAFRFRWRVGCVAEGLRGERAAAECCGGIAKSTAKFRMACSSQCREVPAKAEK